MESKIPSATLSVSDRRSGQRNALLANLFAATVQYIVAGAMMMLYAHDVLKLSPKRISVVLALMPVATWLRLLFLGRIRRLGKVRVLRVANLVRIGVVVLLAALPSSWMGFPLYMVLLLTFTSADQLGAGAVWQPLLRDITTDEDRGRFFSRMRLCFNLVASIATAIIPLVIGDSITAFQYRMLLVAALLGMINQTYWYGRLPERSAADDKGPDGRERERPRLLEVLRRSPLLRRPLLVTLLLPLATLPVYILYLRTMLGMPSDWIAWIVFAGMLGSTLSFLLWGRIADSLGFRPMLSGLLILSITLLPLHLLIAPFQSGPGELLLRDQISLAVLCLQALVGGALGAGAGIAVTTIQHYYVTAQDSLEAMNIQAALATLVVSALSLFSGFWLEDIAQPAGVKAIYGNVFYVDAVKGYLIAMGFGVHLLVLKLMTGLANTRPYVGVGDFFSALTVNPLRFSVAERVAYHEDEARRVQTAEWFGRQSGSLAVQPLAALCRDPSYDVRVAAVRGLARAGHVTAGDVLLVLLRDPGKRDIADHVAWALGELQYEPALEVLIDRLSDEWPIRIRAMAARALGKLGNQSAVPHLTRLLKPETVAKSQHLAASACRALLNLDARAQLSGVLDVLAALDQREERYELMDVLCRFFNIPNRWVLEGVSDQTPWHTLMEFVETHSPRWRDQRAATLETLRDRDIKRLRRLVDSAGSTEAAELDRPGYDSLRAALRRAWQWQPVAVLASAWLLFCCPPEALSETAPLSPVAKEDRAEEGKE